jgi:hypothetical protein
MSSLLFLAGPQASGKSTLLQYCLQNRLPLFGRHSEIFLSFCPFPQGVRDLDLPIRELLSNRHYISLEHLFRSAPQILSTGENVLVHVDTLNARKLYAGFTSTDSRFVASAIEQRLGAFLLKFEVIVNTINVPRAVAAERYSRRAGLRKPLLHGALVSRIYSDQSAYDAIYDSWKMFCSKIATHNLTTMVEGHSVSVIEPLPSGKIEKTVFEVRA